MSLEFEISKLFDIWSFSFRFHSSAKCLVTLANKGEEAFKPDVYGDEITIERTLNKSGGGGYKIKNSDGKTVDAKKTTLDAIREWTARITLSNDVVVISSMNLTVDRFNLQVDNPMTVLTQDQSRQFLAKASAKDKYNVSRFFFSLRSHQTHADFHSTPAI